MRLTSSLGTTTITVINRHVTNNIGAGGCVSTGTLCPVPWGHTSVPARLFMKGHVAPENVNGGWNNQTSASIVFDRHPSYLSLWGMARCSTALPVTMGQVAQIWLLSLYSKVPHSILWLGLHGYIHPPPPPLPAPCVPFPHSCPAWMQECLVSPPVEKVSGVLIALWCVYKCVRVRACEFIVQLSVCTAAGLSVTAWVSGVPLCKDVKVCHWASLWECSQMLSCSSSRLPAEVYNA